MGVSQTIQSHAPMHSTSDLQIWFVAASCTAVMIVALLCIKSHKKRRRKTSDWTAHRTQPDRALHRTMVTVPPHNRRMLPNGVNSSRRNPLTTTPVSNQIPTSNNKSNSEQSSELQQRHVEMLSHVAHANRRRSMRVRALGVGTAMQEKTDRPRPNSLQQSPPSRDAHEKLRNTSETKTVETAHQIAHTSSSQYENARSVTKQSKADMVSNVFDSSSKQKNKSTAREMQPVTTTYNAVRPVNSSNESTQPINTKQTTRSDIVPNTLFTSSRQQLDSARSLNSSVTVTAPPTATASSVSVHAIRQPETSATQTHGSKSEMNACTIQMIDEDDLSDNEVWSVDDAVSDAPSTPRTADISVEVADGSASLNYVEDTSAALRISENRVQSSNGPRATLRAPLPTQSAQQTPAVQRNVATSSKEHDKSELVTSDVMQSPQANSATEEPPEENPAPPTDTWRAAFGPPRIYAARRRKFNNANPLVEKQNRLKAEAERQQKRNAVSDKLQSKMQAFGTSVQRPVRTASVGGDMLKSSPHQATLKRSATLKVDKPSQESSGSVALQYFLPRGNSRVQIRPGRGRRGGT